MINCFVFRMQEIRMCDKECLNTMSFDSQKLSPSHVIKDTVATITSSALRFLSGTVISRITGLLRDMVLAFCFGTNEAIAALFVAFRLSQVCRRLFGEGALQSAFVPVFEELRSDSEARAFYFFRNTSVFLSLFLFFFISMTALGLLVVQKYVAFQPDNLEIVNLTIILLPTLFFICLFGLNISLLQCQKRYFISGVAPAFFNVAVIIGSIVYRNQDPRKAIPQVALFLILGCALQWFSTFLPVLKILKGTLKEHFFKGLKLFSTDLKKLIKPITLGFLGAGATQVNNAIDSLFARYADLEGPAQLWYALRIEQLPLAFFGIAFSGALLPPLARSISSGKVAEYLHFLEFAVRKVFALLIPSTCLVLIVASPLISSIYGYGDFDAHSVLSTSRCLYGYILGLCPQGIIIIIAAAFYAKKNYRIPAIGAIFSLVLNVLLNSIFIFAFDMKAQSVAFATSISAWVNVLFLYFYVVKDFGQIITPDGKKEIAKVFAVSSLVFIILTLADGNLNQRVYSSYTLLFSQTSIFITLFLLLSFLFKAKDIQGLFVLARKTLS